MKLRYEIEIKIKVEIEPKLESNQTKAILKLPRVELNRNPLVPSQRIKGLFLVSVLRLNCMRTRTTHP